MKTATSAVPPVTYPGLPDLATRPQLSEYLGISVSSLAQYAMTPGKGPRYIRLGKHVRYRREDVLAWLDAQGDS